MKTSEFIIILTLIISVVIFMKIQHNDLIYIKSTINDKKYLVRDNEDSDKAANLLAVLDNNIQTLRTHLYDNKKTKYKKYEKYIDQLNRKIKYCVISESIPGSSYTSYSVNKGEEIVFCLRSKKNDKLHIINLLMYVALHELSHVACPEWGHTPLFKDIFSFITEVAISINLYEKIHFDENPEEYCGLSITDSIV